MTINCVESCVYQDNGICTLTHITKPTGEIKSGCPYFKSKKKKTQKPDP